MLEVNRHPIRVAAKRTGTPESTLRAWERRYEAVSPDRADTGRRLYSDADIERLKLLRQAVDGGRPISSVAGLSDRELKGIVDQDREEPSGPLSATSPDANGTQIVEKCMLAVGAMDHASLRSELKRAVLKFPAHPLIDDIIAPLLHRIGDYWYANRLSPRHEHMASSVIRTIMTQLQAGIQQSGTDAIVIATPPGHLHDLGTQFVSALSLAEGLTVVNLGANITAPDIAAATREVGAKIVALSIVYPLEDPIVEETLSYLGRHLPKSTQLIVGGQAASSYQPAIEKAGGISLHSATAFCGLLAERAINLP